MGLDIVAEVQKVNQYSKEKRGAERYRALVYGEKGSGKTTLFSTARFPVHIDCFDPGGSQVLAPEIEKGLIVADIRWETDDPSNPKVFAEWDREFHRRKKEGYFNNFATYGLDSMTTFSQVIMNYVLKKQGRAGGIPQTGTGNENDYIHQMLHLENSIGGIFSLPCDIIVTAHPESDKDEATGKMFVSPLITGKAKIRIPLSFDEMYYAFVAEVKDQGTRWLLQTRPTSIFKASSRLARRGKFDKYEEANIKALLKKAGLPCEDMSIPWLEA
ncbi:MAG: AAA family ATPase [bacterium]|nr:AAA family ATPase [bacterium]